MKVTLNWVNRNTNEDGTRVFRSTQPITSIAEMTPIATLPQGANKYEDEAVVKGTLYYYRLEVFKGADSYLGNQVALTALSYTGPGSQELLKGDFERGYFGEVTVADLMTGDELALRMGYSSGNLVPNATTNNWYKFAHKGKILFIPKLPFRYGVTWTSIFNAGIMYGSNSEIPETLPGGAIAGTAQGKTVEINGDTFVVRCIKGMKTNPATLTMTGDGGDVTNGNADGSEWNDLMYSIVRDIPPSQNWGNLMNILEMEVLGTATPVGLTTVCQELSGTNGCVVRGASVSASSGNVGGAALVNVGSANISATMGPGGYLTRQLGWRPVLEFRP